MLMLMELSNRQKTPQTPPSLESSKLGDAGKTVIKGETRTKSTKRCNAFNGRPQLVLSMHFVISVYTLLWTFQMNFALCFMNHPTPRKHYSSSSIDQSSPDSVCQAHLLIPISKWEDLTDDQEAIDTLREVYDNNVEKLDLLVGMAAEKKINGFAISETAFVIFIIMASRRLEADRFFTSDFNEDVYTKKGLEWVNTTESLKDVLDRHYPEMTDRWMNSNSAFSVVDMINLIGKRGEKVLSEIGFTAQMVSMGHQACGALDLWNYPMWLRDVVPQNMDGTDRPDHIDLASLESK
nr:alpha-dioxygenase 1-like [Tanacetum cinerariifolium]